MKNTSGLRQFKPGERSIQQLGGRPKGSLSLDKILKDQLSLEVDWETIELIFETDMQKKKFNAAREILRRQGIKRVRYGDLLAAFRIIDGLKREEAAAFVFERLEGKPAQKVEIQEKREVTIKLPPGMEKRKLSYQSSDVIDVSAEIAGETRGDEQGEE